MINSDVNVRTLHIDSRCRASGSAEDMVVELREPLELPRGCVCWLTQANIPFCWGHLSTMANSSPRVGLPETT